MSVSLQKMHIGFVGDILCPLCWIGKRSMERAAQKHHLQPIFRWKPYQLEPSLPTSGLDKIQYYERMAVEAISIEASTVNNTQHFSQMILAIGRHPSGDGTGSEEEASILCQKATNVGISLKLIEGSRIFNSLRAHRLLWYVQETHGEEVMNKLLEILLRRYHSEGAHLGFGEELVDCCREIGAPIVHDESGPKKEGEKNKNALPSSSSSEIGSSASSGTAQGQHPQGSVSVQELTALINHSKYLKEVSAELRSSHRLTTNIPLFILPNGVEIEGFQEVDTLADLLEKALLDGISGK